MSKIYCKDDKPKKLRGNQQKVFACVPVDGSWIPRLDLRIQVLSRGFRGGDKSYDRAIRELIHQGDVEINEGGSSVRLTQMWMF